MSSICGGRRKQRRVRIGAADGALTANAGLVAVTELCGRLGVIEAVDAAVGSIKQRDRGFGAGELLTGIAAAQLAGEDFLAGLDRQRADAAGQQISPVPGLASTTAAGLARRITAVQWEAVERGLAAVTGRMLGLLPAERAGRVGLRADAGYFAGRLARAAHDARIAFAIGARRIAPLWRLLDGVAEDAWHDAIEMDNAQVAVTDYCPGWWPADTRLLIRRVLLDPAQVSADPRSRRRRTLHPDQRALPFPELAQQPAVYAYSFILTNLDVSSPARAAAAEHWYRHRTTVENLFRDSKLGAALRHLPSGYPQVNLAWMWGALLAAAMAAWLHQLTATALGEDIVHGHGVRGGKAMIATLRWRLIAVPGRLVRHARHLVLRLPPGHGLLPEVLARLRELPEPRLTCAF